MRPGGSSLDPGPTEAGTLCRDHPATESVNRSGSGMAGHIHPAGQRRSSQGCGHAQGLRRPCREARAAAGMADRPASKIWHPGKYGSPPEEWVASLSWRPSRGAIRPVLSGSFQQAGSPRLATWSRARRLPPFGHTHRGEGLAWLLCAASPDARPSCRVRATADVIADTARQLAAAAPRSNGDPRRWPTGWRSTAGSVLAGIAIRTSRTT